MTDRGDHAVARSKTEKNKAQKTRNTKRGSNWVLYIAVVAFVLYIAVTIVDQNVKIRSAQDELAELDDKISLQKIKIEELKTVAEAVEKNDLDSYSDYIERIAREELGYVKSGEVVYINIAGD